MKKRFFFAVFNIIILCAIIFFISFYFIYDTKLIGLIVFVLGVFCLVSLLPFKIKIKTILPDIIFGLIDNGILAIMAVFGGKIAGVVGAVIGGVVGNAITDGIAGIFEGYAAERMRRKNISDQRTMLGSAVGKTAGCLLGAGAVLMIVNLLKL